MDLGEHLVEAVDQLADLVSARAFDAHVVAAAVRHRAGDRGQTQQRRRDDALHAARRARATARTCRRGPDPARGPMSRPAPTGPTGPTRWSPCRSPRGSSTMGRAIRSDAVGELRPLIAVADGERVGAGMACAGSPRRCGRTARASRPSRSQMAVETMSSLTTTAPTISVGAFAVGEGDRGRAVGADDVGEHAGVANQPVPRVREIEGHQNRGRDDQRDGARDDADAGQLPRQRQPRVPRDDRAQPAATVRP